MFNCGGNYTNTTNAGVFYSNGNNNTRTNTYANIGFRSALPRPKGQMPGGYGSPVKQAHRPHPMRRIREAKDSSSVPSPFGGQKSQTVAVGGPEAPAISASPTVGIRRNPSRHEKRTVNVNP